MYRNLAPRPPVSTPHQTSDPSYRGAPEQCSLVATDLRASVPQIPPRVSRQELAARERDRQKRIIDDRIQEAAAQAQAPTSDGASHGLQASLSQGAYPVHQAPTQAAPPINPNYESRLGSYQEGAYPLPGHQQAPYIRGAYIDPNDPNRAIGTAYDPYVAPPQPPRQRTSDPPARRDDYPTARIQPADPAYVPPAPPRQPPRRRRPDTSPFREFYSLGPNWREQKPEEQRGPAPVPRQEPPKKTHGEGDFYSLPRGWQERQPEKRGVKEEPNSDEESPESSGDDIPQGKKRPQQKGPKKDGGGKRGRR